MTRTTARVIPAPAERIAVLYIRLSHIRGENLDELGVEKTFNDREKAMRERCAALGWKVGQVIYENDLAGKKGRMRGVSAFKRKKIIVNGEVTWRVVRKGFADLLRMLKTGVGNAVMCEDLDRLMRDPYDAEDLMQVAKVYGTTVKSLSGSFELTNGGNDGERATARVLVAMAAKASEDTARRVAAGKERKANRGEWTGGIRPFGFQVKGKQLVLDPVESEIVRDFSHRLIRKQPPSLRELTAELRTKGVPTVRGAKWSPIVLRQILTRPRNAGIEVFRGQEIGKANFPAIVTEAVFRQVVRKLSDPARRTNHSGGPAPRYLGSGIFRCGVCGSRVNAACNTKRGGKRQYVCAESRHVTRLVEHVDTVVRTALFAYIAEQRSWPAKVTRSAGPSTSLAELNAERDAARAKLDALAEDYVADVIDRAQLRAGTERAKARIAELDAKIQAHFSDESAATTLLVADDVEAAWDAMPLAEQRAVVAELLTVTINRVGSRWAVDAPDALVIGPARPDGGTEETQMEQSKGDMAEAA